MEPRRDVLPIAARRPRDEAPNLRVEFAAVVEIQTLQQVEASVFHLSFAERIMIVAREIFGH